MSIAKVFDLKQIHGFGIQGLLHQRMGKGNDIWERLRVDRHCFAKQILADRSSKLRELEGVLLTARRSRAARVGSLQGMG